MNPANQNVPHAPWNKGKLIGQKLPLKLKEIWAIRIRLQMAKNTRELALFNLAIDGVATEFGKNSTLSLYGKSLRAVMTISSQSG